MLLILTTLEPENHSSICETEHLASAPTCSRLAPQRDWKDLDRLTRPLGDHGLARDAAPPHAMVRAVDQAEEPTDGPPAFPFAHPHEPNHGSRPRGLVAGPSPALVTASLRPGPRPTAFA